LQENNSIKDLNIGKNFSGIKPKLLKRVMESIVELIQEEDSVRNNLVIAISFLQNEQKV